jgi:methanogenic corrinoid protein MtbC1
MKEKLIEAIADVQEREAIDLTRGLLDSGADPHIALEACKEGMAIIGRRYEEREYFLPHLIIAGEIMKQVAELVKPHLKTEVASPQPRGKIVIGTVAGDIHDIGKDIVAFMLDANDFEIHDLGVDVPAEKFVEKIKEVQPEIVGMSGFLTLAFDQMKDTVEAIRSAGLREQVKIMIGGAPMDEKVARYIGADAFGADASAAVNLAKGWMGGR